jgi:hypothetical protein
MRSASRTGRLASACALSFTVLAGAASAQDFDGTKRLLCATTEARDCVSGLPCHHGLAEDVGAPQFLRIDFEKRSIAGDRRTTPIAAFDSDADRLLLQGVELGYGWSIAIDRKTGRFSGSMTNADGVFVLLGACTAP